MRRLLLVGLTLGVILSAWQATLPGFEWMLASRIIEGMSHLAVVVTAPTLIAELTPRRHQGLALTLWGSYFGVAFAVIALAAPAIIAHMGLGGLSFLHTFYMAAVTAILAATLPRPERRAAPPWPSAAEIIRRHVTVYASPYIGAPALGWLFYTLTFVAMLAVLPPMLGPESRAIAAAAMPLASIASSMTLGNLLLRHISAVQVIIAGYAIAIALLVLFLATGPAVWLFVALFAAIGLVQGASFAAVPELNEGVAERALANGGIAQTGNIGNALGTPALLAAAATGAPAALPLMLMIFYAAGIAMHLLMAVRRRSANP